MKKHIMKKFFRAIYAAWVKFGTVMGFINLRIILSILFFIIVTPVGLLRRLAGKDSLRIRQFKKGRGSVMVNRDHVYTREDLLHTF